MNNYDDSKLERIIREGQKKKKIDNLYGEISKLTQSKEPLLKQTNENIIKSLLTEITKTKFEI